MNNIFEVYGDQADHMVSLYKKYLIGIDEFDYYKHSNILKRNILNGVSDKEKEYIENIVRQDTKNVGLQYFTGFIINEKSKEWFSQHDRKWNAENVKAFINLCSDNGVNLIVLNSETYDPSLQESCTQKLSIAGYAYLISKMDLVVGVDSSAGHIAAFYDIPSITLWSCGSPVKLDGKLCLGFRPLRKNYSVVPRNKDISSISSDAVYSLVEKFFKGELSFKEDIITYQDSVDGYNIIYV